MSHESWSACVRRSFPRVALAAMFAVTMVACDDPTKGQVKASAAAPVASASAAATAGTTFAITPQNSKVEWTGSKVTGSHDGSFGGFTGSVTLVGGAVDKSRVTIDIDTPTLTTVPEGLIKHLKSPDFFGVDQFPKATFASTSIKVGGDKGAGYQVTGNLTLRGVTKSIAFRANITVAGDTINADATFAINRKDFNLSYPGKADDLIRDDVLIKLTIHAAKQS
jgi:polyisoprenoid-binding protein YceI